jgi:hypothetical protein
MQFCGIERARRTRMRHCSRRHGAVQLVAATTPTPRNLAARPTFRVDMLPPT